MIEDFIMDPTRYARNILIEQTCKNLPDKFYSLMNDINQILCDPGELLSCEANERLTDLYCELEELIPLLDHITTHSRKCMEYRVAYEAECERKGL